MNEPTFWGMQVAMTHNKTNWDVFINLSGDTMPVYTLGVGRVDGTFVDSPEGRQISQQSRADKGDKGMKFCQSVLNGRPGNEEPRVALQRRERREGLRSSRILETMTFVHH
jgi:hypothetical protein